MEFGISLPVGKAVIKRLPVVLTENPLPPRFVSILEHLHAHYKYLDEQIGQIEKEISDQLEDNDVGQSLFSIPGVGLLTPVRWLQR